MKHIYTRTICVTGGHLSPAQAVTEALLKEDKSLRILFIARHISFTGDKLPAVEVSVMKNTGAVVETIHASRNMISSPLSFALSFLESLRLLLLYRPDLVVSFGGYVALPVTVVAAYLYHIPVVTHEQTNGVGLANKKIAGFAKRIYVSNRNLLSQLPSDVGEYVGFPFRTDIISPPSQCSLFSNNTKPILYITGGTTGAVSINKLVFPLIPQLTEKFIVVHQTGNDSLDEAYKHKVSLSEQDKGSYIIAPYIKSSDASFLLHHAKIVISRSGANTVWELALTGVPAILVPISWSVGQEQEKNAAWLSSRGAAVVLSQKETSSEELLRTIYEMTKNYERYHKLGHAFSQTIPRSGASELARKILSL